MTKFKNNDPLHGITLEKLLAELIDQYGWEVLADLIHINSFIHDPSIKSSLKFLRRTPWARKEVEVLYVYGEPGLIDYKRRSHSHIKKARGNIIKMNGDRIKQQDSLVKT